MDELLNQKCIEELKKLGENNTSSLTERTAKTIGAAGTLTGAAALLYSAFKKKPGLIQKIYKKELTPRLVVWGKPQKESLAERSVHTIFKPVAGGVTGGNIRSLKKEDIGLLHGFDYSMRKTKKPLITPSGDPRIKEMENKLLYGRRLHKAGIGAKTWSLPQNEIQKIKKMSDKEIIDYLNKKHGIDKWIYKPKSDVITNIPTTVGKAGIITSESLGKKMLGYFKNYPEKFIGQEKLNINKEFRVRTVNGQVVTILPRYPSKIVQKLTQIASKGEFAKQGIGHVPIIRSQHKKGIQGIIRRNPKLFTGSKPGLHTLAFDIALIKGSRGGKGYRVIEANPVSGADIDNPFVASKIFKTLTGKTSTWEKAAKGIGAAGLTTAGGTLAYEAIKPQQNIKSTWKKV